MLGFRRYAVTSDRCVYSGGELADRRYLSFSRMPRTDLMGLPRHAVSEFERGFHLGVFAGLVAAAIGFIAGWFAYGAFH